MATSQNGDEERRTAELTDDGELLPPEVAVKGDDVPRYLVEAVEAALAEEPNTVDAPVLMDNDNERLLATFSARYNELPVCDQTGALTGWKAPYQARERFDAALREALPEGIGFEAHDNTRTDFHEADR
jgi:hypothetical protein